MAFLWSKPEFLLSFPLLFFRFLKWSCGQYAGKIGLRFSINDLSIVKFLDCFPVWLNLIIYNFLLLCRRILLHLIWTRSSLFDLTRAPFVIMIITGHSPICAWHVESWCCVWYSSLYFLIDWYSWYCSRNFNYRVNIWLIIIS